MMMPEYPALLRKGPNQPWVCERPAVKPVSALNVVSVQLVGEGTLVPTRGPFMNIIGFSGSNGLVPTGSIFMRYQRPKPKFPTYFFNTESSGKASRVILPLVKSTLMIFSLYPPLA